MYSFVEADSVSLQKEYISRLKQTQNPNPCATFVRVSPRIHTTLQHFVSSATRSKCSNIQSHGRGFRWRRHWLNVKTEGLETSILLQYDWYKAYSNSSSLKIILIYSILVISILPIDAVSMNHFAEHLVIIELLDNVVVMYTYKNSALRRPSV